MNGGWGISYEIALRWMALDLTDDESTLVQVMTWCRQATSHYLSQCWPRFMLPNGVTRPQIQSGAIDQSHRYGRHLAPCREPAGSYDKTTQTAICFEHKTQYLLIRAPYTRIVVFWHISNIPPMISQSQISCNTHTFYIAAMFVKYCYTTGSWLL